MLELSPFVLVNLRHAGRVFYLRSVPHRAPIKSDENEADTSLRHVSHRTGWKMVERMYEVVSEGGGRGKGRVRILHLQVFNVFTQYCQEHNLGSLLNAEVV